MFSLIEWHFSGSNMSCNNQQRELLIELQIEAESKWLMWMIGCLFEPIIVR